MWTPELPDFVKIADALYDVEAADPVWFEQTARAISVALPGVDQIFIGLGVSEPEMVHGTRMWASHRDLVESANHFAASQPPRYYRRRHAHHSATDWQVMGPEMKELAHTQWLTERGCEDCFVLNASDPSGLLVAFAAFLPDRGSRWPVALHDAWDAIAFHAVAAAKLRAAIASGHARVDAVFETDGKVVDLNGEAIHQRALLRDSVRHVQRSRGRWRDRPSPIAARTPMVSARWTLVDQFESDGRHFVVAYATDSESASALSPQERRVAEHLAAGMSMKRIAYRLGLSIGTIANYASRAYGKLGVRSRIELARALRL